MRDAAKKGVEVKCRKDLRGEISVEELWLEMKYNMADKHAR